MYLNKVPYLSKQYIVLFTIGLLVKLYTIFMFSPEITVNLFAPFVNQFLSNPLQNPYDFFLLENRLDVFPYGSLMLIFLAWIQGIWYALMHSLSSTAPLMLSLLLFDLSLFWVLLKKLKPYNNYVLYLYWLSPLMYYITYIHGQLDIIPTLFLMLSFYFLDNRLGLVSLFLGLAVAIKMNNLLVIPFFLIYLYKNHTSIPKFFCYITYLVLPYVVFNGFLLFSEGFQQIVLFNNVQSELLNVALMLGSVQIYLVPILYGILLVQFNLFTFVIKDLFILFSTITFGIITLFLAPQPGWYVWIIPLIIYTIVQYDMVLIFPYFIWSTLLVVYFIFPNNILYTLIVFIQLLLLVHIYFQIINKYIKTKLLYQPFLIGISGDSGTGKSQLSQAICNFFGERFSIIFCGDDLHKWERGNENWKQFTHLNPIAQNLYNNIKDFINLKQGKKINRTHYDHTTGKFITIGNVISKNIIVHEGLHSLYLKQERKLYDLKIFIDPQTELYHQWKIDRDTTERGYTKEKVLENIHKRQDDKRRYIDIQRQHADIVISFYINKQGLFGQGLKIYSNMILDLEPFLLQLQKIPQYITTIEVQDFQQVLDICITDNVSSEQYTDILHHLCPNIYQYPFTYNFEKNNYDGLVVLFILYNIFNGDFVSEQ